jgi:hypothetical protein
VQALEVARERAVLAVRGQDVLQQRVQADDQLKAGLSVLEMTALLLGSKLGSIWTEGMWLGSIWTEGMWLKEGPKALL